MNRQRIRRFGSLLFCVADNAEASLQSENELVSGKAPPSRPLSHEASKCKFWSWVASGARLSRFVCLAHQSQHLTSVPYFSCFWMNQRTAGVSELGTSCLLKEHWPNRTSWSLGAREWKGRARSQAKRVKEQWWTTSVHFGAACNSHAGVPCFKNTEPP